MKNTRKPPRQKKKGKKVANFCQGISYKHPGILGQFPYPSCTTFLSLETLTHSLTAQFLLLLLFLTFSPISSYNNNNTRIHGDTITAMAITPTPTTTTTLTHSYKKVCKKRALSLSLSLSV